MQGDSDELIAGGGTGGSKSMMTSGIAIVEAADKFIETGKQIAAHVLEAAAADIEFRAGRFVIAGTDRSVGIMELAEKIRAGLELPAGSAADPRCRRISATARPRPFRTAAISPRSRSTPKPAWSRSCATRFVNDFGVVINPLLVDGQAHGGIVQGIGQALREHTVYDETGQLLTGSYMDYAMPRAEDAPLFTHAIHPVPAKTNPLGAKGCGEAGCAGALPSVMNALVDALVGIRHPPHRHAGHPGARLAGDQGGAQFVKGAALVNLRSALGGGLNEADWRGWSPSSNSGRYSKCIVS